ncbi:MAG: tRNA (N(6)-L-threonylcarbamoyladenosine(37)-C(2))-methylthiotransferase MtaB [Clostridia bacterium]|nr:tRNA (N(6)-L-threonylcarbamoyladenosine(37)-C(2))-methylthiotransferase MtaB [Clostridia bacterium]
MKTIATYTLGCKVNQYDTEAMLECFERAGFTPVPFGEEADVCLINTCTVTGTGDQKSRKAIRRVAREHPGCAIVVCGCLAQREAEALLAMDNVCLVLGVQRRGEVVELLEAALATGQPINAVSPLKGAAFEPLAVSRHEGRTRATMKIQEGCDRWCSYCIIPSVRGPVRSMPLEEVRREAARLGAAGYREIVVTGIHLASYGRGTDHGLLDAVACVHGAPGVRRVRLGSLEPVIVTPAFADALAAMPGVMRQFHLSLQSGSATVLARMHRRYTPEAYARAVGTLRRAMPDCALTTDVIVGFPGETEEEFRQTMAFVSDLGLSRIHVFPYSRRSGTLADGMPDQVEAAVKHRRAGELIALGNRLERDFVNSLVGTVQQVLFERAAGPGISEGYTGQYVRVRAAAEPGTIARVHLDSADGTLAAGTVIDREWEEDTHE